MAKRSTTPIRVVCEQNITPEWAQELIRRNIPALRELYRKALERQRAQELEQQERVNQAGAA